MLKRGLIAIIIFLSGTTNLMAQCPTCDSSEDLFLLLERDGVSYFILDESGNFDAYLFEVKAKNYQKKPWYKQDAVQNAIRESRASSQEGSKTGPIPQPIKDYGFTEEMLKSYHKEGSRVYYIFYNWMSDVDSELITFVIETNR